MSWKNYEEGSPLRQYAHFYYPDFTNGRVAYLEKPFELITNEDIKGAFERELKTVPEGSGLTPVLPEGAALNSVTFDPATRVVKADVSRIFITEMNAGSSLEGLILQSLADTLGWYFQTDKVQLTVDGRSVRVKAISCLTSATIFRTTWTALWPITPKLTRPDTPIAGETASAKLKKTDWSVFCYNNAYTASCAAFAMA